MQAEVHVAAAERLFELGQRYTPNRRLLVDVLSQTGPATIDTIRRGRNLPLSSAYRNLQVLEEAGVVRRVASADEQPRFELAEELTEHHHHLRCTRCGRVEDFVMPATLERALMWAVSVAAEQTGFAATEHHLDLEGICANCQTR